jgi:hypothetical protein
MVVDLGVNRAELLQCLHNRYASKPLYGSLSSSKRLTRIQAAIDEPRINLLTVNVAEFIDPAG